eukprot:m.20293 g.20293  ORF g.20293 m.20293 type:complete len:329 (+) comp5235_c0_seq1:165-1151(+)
MDPNTVDLSKPRYDQGSFGGRFKHFVAMSDPRCLLPGLFFDMPIEKSKDILERHKANMLPPTMSEDTVWRAKQVYDSMIHPDTGETILPPFRMSGFAVFGTPLIVGMLLPNPTLFRTIFFQSVNQTHNAAVNFSNRNASQPTSTKDLITGYIGAVLSSVSIAVGLNQLVARANVTAATRTLLSRFVPFPAVATASSCNMLLMRRSELSTGITVHDEEGTKHGASKAAAKSAILQTLVTRVILPAPLLIIPPVAMILINKTPILKRFPRLALPIESAVCVIAFVFGLPFAISMFPQVGTINASEMEPEFQNLKDSKGNPINAFFFNKGL